MKTLILLPLFLLLMSTGVFAQTAGNLVKPIVSTDVQTLLRNNKDIVVLDVRTAQEFSMGHIKGAKNIDIRQADALSQIDQLNRNAVYLVHCRTRNRSQVAVDHMVSAGFKNIYLMIDGYSGWSMNHLPEVTQ